MTSHFIPKGRFGDGYENFPNLRMIPRVCHQCGDIIAEKDYVIVVSESLSDSFDDMYYFPVHEDCRSALQLVILQNREIVETEEKMLWGESK